MEAKEIVTLIVLDTLEVSYQGMQVKPTDLKQQSSWHSSEVEIRTKMK